MSEHSIPVHKLNPMKHFRILFLGLIVFCSCKSVTNAQTSEKMATQKDLIFSLNAYSFSDLMLAKDSRDKEQMYSLFNLLEWCKSKNIKGFDATGYFFPSYPEVPSDDYIKKLKDKAAELDITITGTGIRNNFASPDPKIRAEGVALAKKWIVVASKLGAPVLRCFAGDIPEGYENNWNAPAGWMIECYKELIPFAEKYNVKIGIQNHGDMLQTADQCLYVLNGVNSKWAGIIVDTGNFTTKNPYNDIERLVPYAVNWQVKEFVDGYGGTIKTDYLKLIKIIKDGGYKGFVPVETLKVKGDPYDPFQRVSDMLNQLNEALNQSYTNKK